MADAIKIGKNITIISDGTPDSFDSSTYFPGGVLLAAVKIEGAANDTVVIRDGGTAAAEAEILCRFADIQGGGLKDTFRPPVWCKPYMDATECTLTAGTLVILELA